MAKRRRKSGYLVSNMMGGGTVLRRLYIGELVFRKLEVYRKLYRLTYQELWAKVISDWHRQCQDTEFVERLKALYHAPGVKFKYVSSAMYVNDYVEILKFGKAHFGMLSRFFPAMVEDWLTRCCEGMDLSDDDMDAV